MSGLAKGHFDSDQWADHTASIRKKVIKREKNQKLAAEARKTNMSFGLQTEGATTPPMTG